MKELSKIKVYNVKKFIESVDFDGNKRTLHMFPTFAIMQGDKGILIFDEEAVGVVKESTKDTIEFGLTEIPKEGVFYGMAQYTTNIPIEDIIDEAESEEMELTEFIKRYNYNRRLRSNFSGILDAIDEIGLKKSDYYKEIEK